MSWYLILVVAIYAVGYGTFLGRWLTNGWRRETPGVVLMVSILLFIWPVWMLIFGLIKMWDDLET